MKNTNNVKIFQSWFVLGEFYICPFFPHKDSPEGPYHYDGKWNPTMRRKDGTYGYFENYREVENYCKDNNLTIVIG